MIVRPGQVIADVFPTRAADGTKADPTGSPTGTLYVNGVADAATVTITNVTTGLQKVTFTVPSNLENYNHLRVIVEATISGTATIGDAWSATVFVLPSFAVLGSTDDADTNYPTITCKVGETGVTKSVTITDPLTNEPVDLTDWGDKVLVIERPGQHADVQVVANANITISGDSNETFTFQPSGTVLAKQADFVWSLREVSSGYEIIGGRLAVKYRPLEDEE